MKEMFDKNKFTSNKLHSSCTDRQYVVSFGHLATKRTSGSC